jgi:hypothetical protein
MLAASFGRGLRIICGVLFSLLPSPSVKVAWEMPKGYDDEGLRIKKYEVELRLLRTHVATYTSTDVDTLSHSFTVGGMQTHGCCSFPSRFPT